MPYIEPGRLGYKGTDGTGHAAAEAQRTTNADKRSVVLEALRYLGSATPDEVAAHLRWDLLSVRPRMSELRNEGKIGPTGARRMTPRGKAASVMGVL